MQDEMFDRSYQSARESLNGSIDNGLSALMGSFRKLHDLQWRAPWDAPAPRRRARRQAGLA